MYTVCGGRDVTLSFVNSDDRSTGLVVLAEEDTRWSQSLRTNKDRVRLPEEYNASTDPPYGKSPRARIRLPPFPRLSVTEPAMRTCHVPEVWLALGLH